MSSDDHLMSREEIAAHLGIPIDQVRKAMSRAGIPHLTGWPRHQVQNLERPGRGARTDLRFTTEPPAGTAIRVENGRTFRREDHHPDFHWKDGTGWYRWTEVRGHANRESGQIIDPTSIQVAYRATKENRTVGAIIEMSAVTRPWHAELRGESFYLTVAGEGAQPLPARLDQPWDRGRPNYGSFTVPAELVHALHCALDEVATCRAAYFNPGGGNPWTMTATPGGGVTIAGPAYLYGTAFIEGAITDEITDVEISYEHLHHLRVAIDRVRGA